MNFLRRSVEDQSIGVHIADDPDALRTFVQPGCAAAILRRQTPPDIQKWLDGLDPDILPRGRVVLPHQEVPAATRQLFDLAKLPASPEREWLLADIERLSQMFANMLSAPHLRLRLDVVNTNACRKFHLDAITARLVCTYRGTGTQYGLSKDGNDPQRVFTVQTGAPILLRGSLWPVTPPSGLLHRSPPIEGTGETRLVLVLDPIFDPEDEA